jgi:hypothetical protein
MTILPRGSIALLMFVIVAGPAHGQPPRDAQQLPAKGTAVISGVLLSDDAQPKPLRRARITLTSPALRVGLTTITHDNGTFRFDQLPAGNYTLRAVKEAYVPVSFGAVRPGRSGTPIVLRDGESRPVSLRMPRGGVITGTVTGSDGQPVSGVGVNTFVTRYNPSIGERRLATASMGPSGMVVGANGVTDDRGVYRLFGLAPDDYFVVVALRALPVVGDLRTLSEAEVRRALAEVRSTAPRGQPGSSSSPNPAATPPADVGRSVAYSPVYFPGTTVASQATPITLAKGEERSGVDITLQYVPTARVEGQVISPRAGLAAPFVMLTSTQPAIAPEAGTRQSRQTNPDGTFSFSGVPPGHYTVMGSVSERPALSSVPSATFTAVAEVNVDGQDVTNVMLTLQPGVTLSGRLAFEGAQPPAVDFTKLRLSLPLVQTGIMRPASTGPVQFDASGRFTIAGVPPGVFRTMGASAMQGLRTPIGAWWLKSISIDGREMLDRPLEIRQSSDNVVVTLSDRASALSGRVRDAQGLPAAGAAIVAFGADPSSWFANSRRIAGVRAGADGAYSIRNLPAGEYFIVASYDVDQGEWFDPVVLQRLVAGAMRISLAENEQKAQDVTTSR